MSILKPTRGTQLNQSHPLSKNIKAAWLFNDGVGKTLFDYKRGREGGTNNDGTLISMDNLAAWTSGEKGAALRFDGSNDRVQVNSSTDWQIERTDPMSFSFIQKTISTPNINGAIISNFKTGSVGFQIFAGNDLGPFKFAFHWRVSSGNQILCRTGTNYSHNVWYHVIITYDGSNNANGVTFYVDGVDAGLAIQSNSLTNSIKSTVQPEIGRNPTGASRFNGEIASLIVFDKELNSSEVRHLFNDPYMMFRSDVNPAVFSTGAGIIPFIPRGLGLTQLQGLY